MTRRKYTEAELWQTAPYNTILSFLKHGKDRAIPRRDLVKLTGLDERILRKHIETIRRNNVCILSDVSGYYLPRNLEEVRRYIKKTERTAKSTFYTLRAAREAEKRLSESEAAGDGKR